MSDWLRRCCERAERRDMAVMHRRGVRKVARVLACGLGLVLCGLGGNIAQGEDPTPIAGEEFRTTLFGEEIYVPPGDRRSVTAASFGVQAIPNGPSQMEMLPFGALYVWRNWDDDNRRLRGTFSGVVNDVDYTIGLREYPNWSLIFTWDNFILPMGRSEYVQGQRQRGTELEWSYAFAGAGLGYRLPVHPFRQDSAVNMSLTYEAGYRWFKGTGHTSAQYGVPKDTYEGRIHFRIRADALKRN